MRLLNLITSSLFCAISLLAASHSHATETASAPAAAPSTAEVIQFTPQGISRDLRQASAQFSADMIPLGDLRQAAPFSSNCQNKGTGRWIDTRTWVFDFTQALPPASSCTFTLLPRYGAITLTGQSTFSVSTDGPAVRQVYVERSRYRITEDQLFGVYFNTPIQVGSLLKKGYCQIDGLKERVPLRLASPTERQQILPLIKKENDSTLIDAQIELVACKRRLPASGNMSLVLEAGITAKNGTPSSETYGEDFTVRNAFTARTSCQRVQANRGCIPLSDVYLNFGAEVPKAALKAITLTGLNGKTFKPQLSDEGVSFSGPFPANTTLRLTLPANFKDVDGRPLVNPQRFPLSIAIDEYPPLAKFAARFGIIEQNAGAVLPVTVRNLEPINGQKMGTGAQYRVKTLKSDQEVIAWLKKLDQDREYSEEVEVKKFGKIIKRIEDDRARSWLKDSSQAIPLPKPNNAQDFEVIGLPLQGSGLHIVEVQSQYLGQSLLHDSSSPMYVRAAALVTNLAVHYKEGEANGLVWVTSLDKGEVVAGANVSVNDCKGKPLWQGTTNAQGIAQFDQTLPKKAEYDCHRFISARLGDDYSFAWSNWNDGIELWRFNLPETYADAPAIRFHTTLARTLLRAGEVVHMKHFARAPDLSGFHIPASQELPSLARIHQAGSDEVIELPITWQNGSAESIWTIPPTAKMGTYSVELTYSSNTKGKYAHDNQYTSDFKVSEFKLPSQKGIISPPAGVLIQPQKVEMTLQVQYLSGGTASNLPITVRGQLEPRNIYFSAYDDYTFANGDLNAKIINQQKRNAVETRDEDSSEEDGYTGDRFVDRGITQNLETQALTLDSKGGAKAIFNKLPAINRPHNLVTEMEYQDANGETNTKASSTPLWTANLVVGYKTDEWASGNKDGSPVSILVLDLQGNPVAGAPVTVEGWLKQRYTHRKRQVGGFYAYDTVTRTQPYGVVCTGVSDARGMVSCVVKAKASGEMLLRIQAKDKEQRTSTANTALYLYGDNGWFDVSDNDRMDVLPERRQYEIGHTAKLQVRMPFRQATALVTVEREGVLRSMVMPISADNPMIDLPIQDGDAPNVFVSVLAVRGRVSNVQPTALVDLGKPAYKLGYTELTIGHKQHMLKLQLAADRPVYDARDKAKVRLQVRRPDGTPAKNADIAIAVVDEALLTLARNDTTDLLSPMMSRRSISVHTATAQMQVIGKRHFGKKALPAGGSGGRDATRELFDTLLFWKANVQTNANGEATVEVPLNDSITRFRVVAVATEGPNLFGEGDTYLQVSKTLLLTPAIPPVVREGDAFKGGVAVRNAGGSSLTVTVSANATGSAGEQAFTFTPKTITLAANEAKNIEWDIKVPPNLTGINWLFNANSDAATDSTKASQTVLPALPLTTLQSARYQLDPAAPTQIQLQRPQNALAGRGGIEVLLKPAQGDISGVERHMRAYPYSCLEQQTSKAISLNDKTRWDGIISNLPNYLDDNGMAKYWPDMSTGDPSLTSYVLSISHANGWAIPEQSLNAMTGALSQLVDGRLTEDSRYSYSWRESRWLNDRKLAALDALARYGKARPAQLESINTTLQAWPTASLIHWINILHAMPNVPNQAQKKQDALNVLRSRMILQANSLNLSSDNATDYWNMQSTDTSAAQILLTALSTPTWVPELPRLVEGAMLRQRKGHWDTTTANAWGSLAIRQYQAQSGGTILGSTTAQQGEENAQHNWAQDPKGGKFKFSLPSSNAQLTLQHTGEGKPWATVNTVAAVPLTQPLSAGFSIKKTITPVQQKVTGEYHRGDVLRIRLELESQNDMSWVALTDPTPAGAVILGRGLDTDSAILQQGEQNQGGWWSFVEPSYEGYRAYYQFVEQGKWQVEYTLRLNTAGTFSLPQTKIEAMYAPAMFGEVPNTTWVIKD